jgi:hypothetical protein
MKIKLYLTSLLVAIALLAYGQESDSTLSDVINRGTFTGHARYFFMGTVNEKNLTDYYASAIGAGIGYESPEIKNFRVSFSGFFIYNIGSSDLSIPDPTSGQVNRYEIGLFDIMDPKNKSDLDRLEELFIQYRIHKSMLRYGKMVLKTPFINPQDGRMRPTLEQGLWAEINEINHVRIHAGWITHIAPRSTVNWFKVENSFGLYPSGLNSEGAPSQYRGNISSQGIGLLGLEYKKGWSVSLWNTFIDNVSNTAMLQIETPSGKDRGWYSGLQYVHQRTVGDGGNSDPALRYAEVGSTASIMSGRLGWNYKTLDLNINATYISDAGRYLMPREWGRDPFYTFLPRERNEGYGGVRATSLNASYRMGRSGWKASGGVGLYHLPDVKNVSLNKYAMPSYRQINLDLSHSFKGFLEGTQLQFLYVYKQGVGRDYENPRNIINKVNMSNFNFVLNYRFESFHH